MTDPRKTEADKIKRFVKRQGTQGLIEGMFFQDTAIRYLLGRETKEAQKLRHSLLDIINGEDPLAKIHQQSVNAQIDSIPPKAEHGFLPVAIKSNANADHQIAAIRYLTRFIDTDDVVYQTFWETANGKKSQITNVADAAISALAHSGLSIKQQLRTIALNPQEDQYRRWKAYTILAFYDITRDKSVSDLVCDLADDNSITDLYKQHGEMSPNVQFWYEHEKKMRKEFEHRRDGKTDEQIKQEVVDKVQGEFQEGIFEVIGYMIDHRYSTSLHNDFIYPFMDDPDHGKFQRFDSSRLTTRLCNLLQRLKGHRVQVLCRYRKLPIRKPEIEQIRNTLLSLKTDIGTYSSEQGWIDNTLHSIDYALRTKRDW